MRNRNFIFFIILSLSLFLLAFIGCSKCIETETSIVEVKVIDSYYRPSYVTMHYNAATKTMMPQSHSAIYKITVSYIGESYSFYGKNYYDIFSNKEGEIAKGTLETKKYSNGKITYKMIDLIENE